MGIYLSLYRSSFPIRTEFTNYPKIGRFQNNVTVTPRPIMDENLIISLSNSYTTTTVSLITHLSIVIPKQFPYSHRIHELSQNGPFQNNVTVTPRPIMDDN